MIAIEFETLLMNKYNCYIIKPTAINWTVDSDFVNDGDMISVLDKDGDTISKCVRRRSEQVGKLSYYFRNKVTAQYFKVIMGITASTGQKKRFGLF
jgi:hypothetical protein